MWNSYAHCKNLHTFPLQTFCSSYLQNMHQGHVEHHAGVLNDGMLMGVIDGAGTGAGAGAGWGARVGAGVGAGVGGGAVLTPSLLAMTSTSKDGELESKVIPTAAF